MPGRHLEFRPRPIKYPTLAASLTNEAAALPPRGSNSRFGGGPAARIKYPTLAASPLRSPEGSNWRFGPVLQRE
jgi:hypothetical protein